jgi:hypothetical protein
LKDRRKKKIDSKSRHGSREDAEYLSNSLVRYVDRGSSRPLSKVSGETIGMFGIRTTGWKSIKSVP